MASAQNQSANVDLFDAYFRRADLDRDGRISGNEAVAFFQGSGLPKQVLAQIWAHADQRQTGFLGRAEFYNALRLVTVAQSKRELTPEMVKAALYGPAAAKIPAPKINLAATPAPQFNSAAAAPATQGGAVTPTSSQNLGFRGPQVTPQYSSFGAAPATQGGAVTPTASQDFEFRGPQIRSQFNSAPTATQGGAVTPTSSQNLGFRGLPPSVNVNQQNFISQDGKSIRPPVPPSSSDSQPTQGAAAPGFPSGGSVGGPQPQNSSVSNDWVGGRASGSTTGIPSQVVNKWIAPSAIQDVFGQATSGPTASLPPRPQAGSGIRPPGPPTKDSKPSNISGNGFAPNSSIGVDVFSATPSHPKQNFPLGSVPVSSTIVPVSAGTQSSASPSTQVGGEPQPSQSFAKANNQVSAQTSASRVSPGAGNSASSQSHMSWPRMIQTDVQKYANIFVKVDTDRDGKITGEQAHDLFLKWGLPREVLKQVWDLSDQDNDSMLSVREFCVALYLMERFREGRPLPAVLPSNVMFDLSNIFQPANNYSNAGNIAWRPASGFQQQQPMPGPGAWHMAPPAGGRPPKPVAPSHAVERQLANQQKPRVPELEKHLVNQLSTEEVNSLNSKFKEATEADKKVEELEKEILDAREKIEYFRVKMQELAGNLASKKELLTGMRIGINLKTKDSLASRSSLLMCQMSWHLQNRNHHQFRKKKLPKLRPQSTDAKVVENGAAYDKNEDESAKSAPNSPFASSTVGSPSREFSDSNYGKTTDADASPRNKESQSHDHAGAGSIYSGDKGSDEPAWGTFDNNDDVDSVWGFNAVSTTKDMDLESNKDHYFSGPGEFGLNPIRTGSSQGGGFSQKSRPFTFDDSVPSTPLSAFNSGYSPPRYKDSSEPSFDTFSRYDSFRSTQDTGFFPQPETLGRFDSMRSSRDFDQGNGFPTFDDIPDPFGSSAPFRSSLDSQTPRRDSDPFGSSGPFRTSLDSQTPRRESDFFGSSAAPFRTSFDSQTSRGDSDAFGSSLFRTSFDGQTPRRDSDPFGSSGPFRTSLETPRKDSDHWSAF
ncbi:uncharacterized protein LOC126621284 isoform X6 [Malus sylvestris]|uniref:uncharacterized protein LOC126621284 isoform X6 n=1 Tax=Malus sylvestris TaxID=3752 RepID=UPI0021AD0EF4|nr:uncharacterized protein LOC126621284 isoform X6 [Malus sylvestris]